LGKIDIISASAGSGKTHTLTVKLDEKLCRKQARPEAVIATTFTNRAAAELQERVRSELLKNDRALEAQLLTAARMGTVNSVCGRLLSEFCFELGMSPEQRVIDEVGADLALRRAMSDVVTRDQADELARLQSSWPALDWLDVVKQIVDKARANGIGVRALEECATRSEESFADLFGKPAPDGKELNHKLKERIEEFSSSFDAKLDGTKKTADLVRDMRRILYRMSEGRTPAWHDWLKLANGSPGVKSKELFKPVAQAAENYFHHPRMIAEGRRIIRLVFETAARALLTYDDYKLKNGLVDFVDQEAKALELLDRQDAGRRLAAGCDLVLVDEFQDTSPLQLAIFLKLARLAPESVWVGDQKQAIYSFRGADSRLMDAAIEGILGSAEPETLGKSWRSRPGLVSLTSALFEKAFARYGLDAKRVHLEAAEVSEPEGLGQFIERWRFSYQARESMAKNAECIAAGVEDLLGDPDTRVRTGKGEPARRIRPGDVAVLCRTNKECLQVSRALQSAGIRAAIPRVGLLGTLEALVTVAGLRLWIDPEDRLADAILSRLLDHPRDPQAWLSIVLEADQDESAIACQAAENVRRARESDPLAGPISAFDRVIEALSVPDKCVAWGDAGERLANLDALRGHAVGYLASRGELGGDQGTVAGLLAWFEELAAGELDARATVTGPEAVVVTTWHKSKGLEWPVVVLGGLGSQARGSALGVQMVSDREGFDMSDPLAGRWIRYWPRPFHPSSKNGRFFEALAGRPEQKIAEDEEERERLRLLYVIWTRARDKIVLPGRKQAFADGILGLLCDRDGMLVKDVDPPEKRKQVVAVEWAGEQFDLLVRVPEVAERQATEPRPGEGVVPAGPREYPPATVNPSYLEGAGASGRIEEIGERLIPAGKPDMRKLGEALHGFFAADLPGIDPRVREKIAADLLAGWGADGALAPLKLLQAADNLRAWVEGELPGAKWQREVSIQHLLESGSLVNGYCDLALECDGGWVVIDHKSFTGTKEQAIDKARSFAPQLYAYADAIEAATGKQVIGCWIHLVLMGMMVEVRRHC
jgi:ATP-dependent helicase/nuclease subunit A